MGHLQVEPFSFVRQTIQLTMFSGYLSISLLRSAGRLLFALRSYFAIVVVIVVVSTADGGEAQ
jgi:hypothetical protein